MFGNCSMVPMTVAPTEVIIMPTIFGLRMGELIGIGITLLVIVLMLLAVIAIMCCNRRMKIKYQNRNITKSDTTTKSDSESPDNPLESELEAPGWPHAIMAAPLVGDTVKSMPSYYNFSESTSGYYNIQSNTPPPAPATPPTSSPKELHQYINSDTLNTPYTTTGHVNDARPSDSDEHHQYINCDKPNIVHATKGHVNLDIPSNSSELYHYINSGISVITTESNVKNTTFSLSYVNHTILSEQDYINHAARAEEHTSNDASTSLVTPYAVSFPQTLQAENLRNDSDDASLNPVVPYAVSADISAHLHVVNSDKSDASTNTVPYTVGSTNQEVQVENTRESNLTSEAEMSLDEASSAEKEDHRNFSLVRNQAYVKSSILESLCANHENH